MKIFVCVKQVPDTETKLKILPDGKNIDPTGVKWILNPYDEYAIEEALKLRDSNPGSLVTAISVGPKKRVSESLRSALAMGADEAVVIDSLEQIDTYATASVLTTFFKQEKDWDLIFSGKMAIDDQASSIPQMIAEKLEIPHASPVSKFVFQPESAQGWIQVERDVEGGAKEVLHVKTPCIIAANKGLNNPRYANLPGIMKAKKKIIKELEFTNLLSDPPQNKTQLLSLSQPPEKPAVQMISGDSAQQVKELVKNLRDQSKVL